MNNAQRCLLAAILLGILIFLGVHVANHPKEFITTNCNRGSLRSEKNITTAKLDDGRIIIYDICANRVDAYDSSGFEFIGWGVIHSVDGIEQNFTERMCFFVRSKL